jgi:UDP-GlcNAc:undecaprenyl-phosphate GlcNAc-1-phosphate transferase
MSHPAVISVAALFVCAALTPVVRRIAFKLGMVDMPDVRKVHAKPMPLLGGVAICISTVATAAVAVGASGPQIPIDFRVAALQGVLLLLVGVLDDSGKLHHQIKLLVAMPLAALGVILAGLQATVFSFGSMPGVSALGNVTLTLFWIVGITAAFSILDHMDGLCAGVAALASLFFLILGVQRGDLVVTLASASLLGAASGFLLWNFNPARIFMGDGGAMFLGFCTAVLGVAIQRGTARPIDAVVPLCILAVPILDTTLVTISRGRRGLVPFASSPPPRSWPHVSVP